MKQYVSCDLCSSCFESHLKLNVHRRRKHVLETSNAYRDDERCKPSCQFCKKTCSSLAHLNLHIRRKHELESDDEASTLNMSDHHKPQMECGDSNSELKFKKNNPKEQATRCDICGQKFLSISKYNFHFKIKHSRTAKDVSCSFSSPSCVKIESPEKETLAATSSRHLVLKDQHSNSLQEQTKSRINPYIQYDHSSDDHKPEKVSKFNTHETKLSKKPTNKVDQPERPIPDLICIESDPEIEILKVISPRKTTCKNKNKDKLENIKKAFVISSSAAEINPSDDLICPKCDQRFEYRAKLNFHYKVKHINALLMNKEQSDRDSFHTLNDFKTQSQERKVSSATGKKIKPSTYMCLDCCKIFSSVSKLKFHRRVNHVDADDSGLNKYDDSSHIYSCCICKRTFSTSEELIKHYQEFHKHHLFINNFDCGSSQTNINLTKDKCSFDCCKVKDFGIPMTGCDISASDGVVKEEITLRSKTAQLQTDSIFGIVKSPPESESILYLKNKTKDNFFKTPTCISKFNANYESEIRQYYSSKKLSDVQETRKACTAPECLIEENPCGIISIPQQHLQNLTCELCEKYQKTLVSSNDLEKIHYNHQMNVYECEACHRTFRRKHDLSRHSVVHYKRLDGECVCKYCGKQFTAIENLNRHTKMAHSSFICTICNRNYPKKAVLREHLNRAHCITCSSAQTMFIRKSLQ